METRTARAFGYHTIVSIDTIVWWMWRMFSWEKAGTALASLPPETVMEAGDMVDAARLKLMAQLSKNAPAERYRVKVVGASA